MPPKTHPKTEESFESGLERLKTIAASLEKADVSLDDALNGFEEGIKLSRDLSDKLTQAEARLERLMKGGGGQPKTSPLPWPDEDEDEDGRYDEEDEDEDEYDEDSDDEDDDDEDYD